MSVRSQIWLPNTGPRESFQVGPIRFWAADGQVIWEDVNTGKSGAMFPDRALKVVREAAEAHLGKGVESSSCRDSKDRRDLQEFLDKLERLAKENLHLQPSRKELESLLYLPGQ